MKCRNCGGHYRWFERKCPYCDEVNLAGRVWMDERSRAEREFAARQAAAGKKLNRYVLNRALTRILLLMVLLLVLALMGSAIVSSIDTHFRYNRHAGKEELSEAAEKAEAYFEAGEYGKLYRLLSDGQYFSEDFVDDRLAGAAFLGNDFDSFERQKNSFLELTEEERHRDYNGYYLRYALDYAWDVVNFEKRNWWDVSVSELPSHEFYVRAVHAGLISRFNLTEEEYETFMGTEEGPDEEELNRCVELIRERNGWEIREETP